MHDGICFRSGRETVTLLLSAHARMKVCKVLKPYATKFESVDTLKYIRENVGLRTITNQPFPGNPIKGNISHIKLNACICLHVIKSDKRSQRRRLHFSINSCDFYDSYKLGLFEFPMYNVFKQKYNKTGDIPWSVNIIQPE